MSSKKTTAGFAGALSSDTDHITPQISTPTMRGHLRLVRPEEDNRPADVTPDNWWSRFAEPWYLDALWQNLEYLTPKLLLVCVLTVIAIALAQGPR